MTGGVAAANGIACARARRWHEHRRREQSSLRVPSGSAAASPRLRSVNYLTCQFCPARF
jgi:hypothetical protein